MWNERRNNMLKHDVYRARKTISVFEKIGFVISGTGKIANMMSYSDSNVTFDDFMIDSRDVALISKTVYDILDKVGLQIPFFDFMYDSL